MIGRARRTDPVSATSSLRLGFSLLRGFTRSFLGFLLRFRCLLGGFLGRLGGRFFGGLRRGRRLAPAAGGLFRDGASPTARAASWFERAVEIDLDVGIAAGIHIRQLSATAYILW